MADTRALTLYRLGHPLRKTEAIEKWAKATGREIVKGT